MRHTIGNILIISKREVKRLRSRFRGSSRPLVLGIIVGSLVLASLAFREGGTLSKGIYRIGISPNGPTITDPRFATVVVQRDAGYELLRTKALDAYVDGDQVVSRNDVRSVNAAGALKRPLERSELARVQDSYASDRAFPLRIEVNYLQAPQGVTSPGESWLEQLIAPATPYPSPLDESSTGSQQGQVAGLPSASLEGGTITADEQIQELDMAAGLGRLKVGLAEDKTILIPSLMVPPIPFAQVILAFLYVLPMFFISVFFSSSFMEEKIDRRLTTLLSTPVTPLQIILGKMMPYLLFCLLSVVVITVLLKGSILMALAIFIPVILFIFAIYLPVPLVYRTFKDTTFFSMAAITISTSYLVFPAMFSGINDLAYMSPLTMAVQMYRGESIGIKEYLFSAMPMALLFALSLYVGTCILNEEYLMVFRPLYRKVADALYLAINRQHPYLSMVLLTLLLVPIVYMVQLGLLALSMNLPPRYAFGALLILGAIVEEMSKAAGIGVLLEGGDIRSIKEIALLSLLAAIGFLIGEKALLYISLSTVSESLVSPFLMRTELLIIPLLAHFSFTLIVGLLTRRLGAKYWFLAVLVGSSVHVLYNLYVAGMIR